MVALLKSFLWLPTSLGAETSPSHSLTGPCGAFLSSSPATPSGFLLCSLSSSPTYSWLPQGCAAVRPPVLSELDPDSTALPLRHTASVSGPAREPKVRQATPEKQGPGVTSSSKGPWWCSSVPSLLVCYRGASVNCSSLGARA